MYGRMAEYPVNRGIGKPVEFKGLKSQYLFIFAGGLLAVFVVFIVLFMAGVNQWVCIGFIVSASRCSCGRRSGSMPGTAHTG